MHIMVRVYPRLCMQLSVDTWIGADFGSRPSNMNYLASSRDAPDVRALPADVALTAVVIPILLLQKLKKEKKSK